MLLNNKAFVQTYFVVKHQYLEMTNLFPDFVTQKYLFYN